MARDIGGGDPEWMAAPRAAEYILATFSSTVKVLPMMWTACLVCLAMSEVDVLPMCASRCRCAKVILCTMYIQCALIMGQVLHI